MLKVDTKVEDKTIKQKEIASSKLSCQEQVVLEEHEGIHCLGCY